MSVLRKVIGGPGQGARCRDATVVWCLMRGVANDALCRSEVGELWSFDFRHRIFVKKSKLFGFFSLSFRVRSSFEWFIFSGRFHWVERV